MLALMDVVRAYFNAWLGYNHIFFHHLLMDNFTDKVFHTAIGMAHDVTPSNNAGRGGAFKMKDHIKTSIGFCGGPSPVAMLALAAVGVVELPSWFFLGCAFAACTSTLCHFTHRAVHKLSFREENWPIALREGLLEWHEAAIFYPIQKLTELGLVSPYDGHYGHHYDADGVTNSVKAIRRREDRGGFAMFGGKHPLLSWTLSLDYVDRDAYTFAFVGDYVIFLWGIANFALRFYAFYCDRVLTAALIQWAVLVYAKLAKPAFEDITIPEQVVDNYDILWDEKAKLYSGDHKDLPKESACYGLNPRGYDEVTKRNFKIIKEGEFTEWKRVYAKDGKQVGKAD